MTVSRRQMLGHSATALATALLPRAAWARAAGAAVPPAPVARRVDARDTYFGETLADPYRWMENDKDPDWLPFLRGQNAHARAILDALPGRDRLLARIRQLSGETVVTAEVQRAGGRLFFEQRPAGSDNYKLFVREGSRDRLLIDPTALSTGGAGHTSLDWWRASPDGTHLVYGLSKDGSEDSVLHVLTTADGRDLPERILNTQGASPAWLDDGSGFFYNQLTGAVNTPERYLDSQARFHRLGTDPAADPVVMKRGLDPSVAYEKIQAPIIAHERGSRWAVLILGDVRPELRLHVAPLADVLAGRAAWRPLAGFEDEVTDITVDGDTAYLVVTRGSPRGRLVRVALDRPDLAAAVTVVPASAQVIQGTTRAKDGLYLRMMDGGVSRLRRFDPASGRTTEVALPFDGTIGGVFADPDEPGALIGLTGWLTSSGIWSVDPAGRVADTGLTPRAPVDTSPYVASRAFATARDGTKIPYSLIHRRDTRLDGRAPAFIQAYGSYGAAAYTPTFQGRLFALMDAGAVVGYANVRGGGEYGREWHKAGQLANKPNTWRDLIDVCEELVRRKVTSPAKLVIGGRSAGGITVGRAMTERPELFAAVVDGVGWSNPLRYVVEQNGYGEEPEWGAIADPAGYRYLKAIDSYQAVRDGTRYPAVLLTTGATDPRVAPFHVAKMAARLQAATTSGKPVLLRVDFDAGHGIGSTRPQQDAEAADTYAFILAQTGSMAPA
jgi:prolyl oligopeptidase